MMKNLRQSKGITLIALVITIIVLLILAGVAISMLSGENGIINKTNSAKEENETATVEEQVKLAAMAALAAGNGEIKGTDAFKALNDGLDEAGYEEDDIEEGDLPATITIDGNDYVIEANGTARQPNELEKLKGGQPVDTTKTLKDAEGKQVVIPERFSVASDSASLVKEGIVVIAPDKSEFVWVPVEDINSMVMCQGSKDNTGENDCKITLSGDKLVCTKHPDKDICGKLYETSTGEKFDSKLDTQKYSATSGLREPAVLTSTSNGDCVTGVSTKGVELIRYFTGMKKDAYTDSQVIDKWTENLQDEFNEMAKSVYDNKGFYVGRYETSLDGDKAQSKANKPSATAGTKINEQALTWYGLYQIEKDYNKKEYEEGKTLESIVGSTMIWGSQYDQMMLWMYDNGKGLDITSTDSTKLNGATKNTDSTTTGVPGDKDKLNNVYDLLGCHYEWTLEASSTVSRVSRGGIYFVSLSASCRNVDIPSGTGSTSSSRATLYIK